MIQVERKSPSFIWVLVLLFVVIGAIFQTTFTWASSIETGEEDEFDSEYTDENHVYFLTIEFRNYFSGNNGIKRINEKLEMWSHDKRREMVELKHSSSKPSEQSQVMVVVDSGETQTERSVDIQHVVSFPYKNTRRGDVFYEVKGIDEEGRLHIKYGGKEYRIASNDSVSLFETEGRTLRRTEITNHGNYNLNQFKLMGEDDGKTEIKEGSENGRRKLDLNQFPSRPLEVGD